MSNFYTDTRGVISGWSWLWRELPWHAGAILMGERMDEPEILASQDPGWGRAVWRSTAGSKEVISLRSGTQVRGVPPLELRSAERPPTT